MFSLLSRGASDRAVGPPKVETRASEKTRSLKPTSRSNFREPGAFDPKDLLTASENRQPFRRSDPRRCRRSRPSMTARPTYCTFRAYLGRTPGRRTRSTSTPAAPTSRTARAPPRTSGSACHRNRRTRARHAVPGQPRGAPGSPASGGSRLRTREQCHARPPTATPARRVSNLAPSSGCTPSVRAAGRRASPATRSLSLTAAVAFRSSRL